MLIEQIKGNLTTVDRKLLYLLYEQQVETNRLLSILTSEKEQVEEKPAEHIQEPKKRPGRPKSA